MRTNDFRARDFDSRHFDLKNLRQISASEKLEFETRSVEYYSAYDHSISEMVSVINSGESVARDTIAATLPIAIS